MPFDPRSFPPEDFAPDRELHFPGPLRHLAEQLVADADRLSELYPAPNQPILETGASFSPLAARDPHSPVRAWKIAAGFLAVCVAGILVAFAWMGPGPRDITPTIAVQTSGTHAQASVNGTTTGKSLAPATAVNFSAWPQTISPSSSARGFKPGPSTLMGELTAPELEGMLDLLDQQTVAPASLSI